MPSSNSRRPAARAAAQAGGNQPFTLPQQVRVSSMFIDESGSKNSAGGFFVVGFVKTRGTPVLARAMRALRQKHHFHAEAKFGEIRPRSMPFYLDLVEMLAAGDVRVGGSVYDSSKDFGTSRATWEVQAKMSAQLVIGNRNPGELLNVFVDLVQTPAGCSVAHEVETQANQKLGSRAVLAAYDMDSQASDLLQLADIVAGSIAYERRQWAGDTLEAPGEATSPKGQVAARLRRALGLDSFQDTRAGKVNILTMRGYGRPTPEA